MKNVKWLCLLLGIFGIPALHAQRWDSIHTGLNLKYDLPPNFIYADSNYLYMAGRFHIIDGLHMQGIARWNGVRWDSMGAGIDRLIMYDTGRYNPDQTYAMIPYNNRLYVGGEFSSVGYLNAPGIGTWNGTAWDTIPVQPFKNESYMGTSGTVFALAVINNKLYMGGEFDTVAGKPCIGIACWNDTNWSSLNFPGGFSFELISSICEYQGSIYAAGHFAGYNGGVGEIIRYDSLGWHSVDTGIKGTMDWINTMAVYKGELYVAGYFYKSDGNVGNCIQKWDGTSWSDVGGGIDHQVYNLIVYNGKLYAMGIFTKAGGVPVHGIAEWDGTKWCSFAGYIDNNVISSACLYHDSLCIGGNFAINDTITDLAEWVGGNYTDSCGTISTAGVSEVKGESENVKVYPNPTNQNVTVQFTTSQNEDVEFMLYNLMGEMVYDKKVSEQTGIVNQQINTYQLPNGLYLLKVNEGNKYMTQKIIKQN